MTRSHPTAGVEAWSTLECNAARVYAPVVMVNWEFFDNTTPQAGPPARRRPARREPGDPDLGAQQRLVSWRAAARILAELQRRPGHRGSGHGIWADLVGLKAAGRARLDRAGAWPGGRAREGAAVTDTLTPVLTAHRDQPDIFTIDGTGETAAGRHRRRRSTCRVPTSSRSRGTPGCAVAAGRAFGTGVKWGFCRRATTSRTTWWLNADESEPRACKDVPLMMANPHLLIEGAAIACYAMIGETKPRVHLRPGRGPARDQAAA